MASTLRALFAPALVLTLAGFATTARADYTYAASGASLTGSQLPFTAQFTPVTGTVSGTGTGRIMAFNINYSNLQPGTDPTNPVNGSTTFNFTETFTAVPGTGSTGTQTFSFTGTFGYVVSSASRIDAGFTVTNVTSTGSGYTVPQLLVNYYTLTDNTATIQLTVIPSVNAVPEPASVAMLGLGLVGALGVAARRRRAAARA